MASSLLAIAALLYAGGIFYGWHRRRLDADGYPSPAEARREIEDLARGHPDLCVIEEIGRSTEDRPIQALRVRGSGAANGGAQERPQLLVTAHIHAIEYIGSYVARALARRLVNGYGAAPHITELLDRADVWLVPLLNPDGAERIWRRGGWSGLGGARFTANGVDPNRNFPFVPARGRRGWNTGSDWRGSPYYRGPHPLSEPECLALVRLCERERFCAAINFHSFSGVVFMPEIEMAGFVMCKEPQKAAHAFSVFADVFQAHQKHLRYRPVPERRAAIVGQLDPFLLDAFGTISVTIEVSRPGWYVLLPWNLLNFFSWANPPCPRHWAENDVEASVHALAALLERTSGKPCEPVAPELGRLPRWSVERGRDEFRGRQGEVAR